MKSCTVCETDIADDMRICEHCGEVTPVNIPTPFEVEPEAVDRSGPSEINSEFEMVLGDGAISSDIEAGIETVQIDISASPDIEAGIETVQIDISASSDIEASIDTLRVDSSEFSNMEADCAIEISYRASNDRNYEQEDIYEDVGAIEEPEETVVEEEIEDTSSPMPVMYYDDVSANELQQGGFVVPAPLYSDSGVMMAQHEMVLPVSLTNDEDSIEEAEEEGILPTLASPTFVQPTLFYGSVQSALQPTVEAPSFEKVSKKGNPARPRFSMIHSLIILLVCLIVITSSGISILLVRAHSHAMMPEITPTAHLKVKPGSLNFGQVTAGTKAILAAVVANTGAQVMNWYVDTGNLAWLKVGTSVGSIQPGGPEQFIYTTADTSQLKVGNYSGDEDIHSNGGNTRVPIQIAVVPSTGKKEAKLNVDQTGIDLGSALPSQLITSSVTVGNVGNQSLNWHASVGDTSWLSLGATPPTGTIPAGGFPQTFNITANTTNLALGNYSAMLDIQSNGGDAHIGIFLVVSASPTTAPPTLAPPIQPTLGHPKRPTLPATVAPTQVPTAAPTLQPTAAPTQSPPTWSVTPSTLDSSCLVAGCVVTLTEDTASIGNINWTAGSDVGASFSPANGTVAPGASQQVTISGMTCNNGTITFSGTSGAIPLTVTWTCGVTPTPTTPPIIIAPTAPPPTVAPTAAITPSVVVSPTTVAAPAPSPPITASPTPSPTAVVLPTAGASPTPSLAGVLYDRARMFVGCVYCANT